MTTMGTAVCGYCGAPLRELIGGACPYCKTPVVAPGTTAPPPGLPDVPAGTASGFAVRLLDAGRNKIAVIKVVREATGLGLKEAKDIADAAAPAAPQVVRSGLDAGSAAALEADLAAAGGTADRIVV